MMPISTDLVALVHLACLAPLAVYGAHRVATLNRSRRADPLWRDRGEPPALASRAWPRVVVQLPLYNERHVAGRLLEAVGALEYPRDRFEVQVLDDSTDETCEVVDAAVARLVAGGVRASVLRRPDRAGFKAGALSAGLDATSAEFCAVFDADFVPRPDFLRRLMPEFDDPGIGMVQARWDHLARDESALSRAQAVLLDGHFAVEHAARHGTGLWFNFNGTAGVWRRATIEAAGGWEHDTLTEDLDLSYRAQLAGWRFVYRPDVTVPAELPGSLGAFLGQQRRWARGGVQVLRKLSGRLVRARVPLRQRVEALVHLTANVGYPLLLVLALSMPLMSLSGMLDDEKVAGGPLGSGALASASLATAPFAAAVLSTALLATAALPVAALGSAGVGGTGLGSTGLGSTGLGGAGFGSKGLGALSAGRGPLSDGFPASLSERLGAALSSDALVANLVLGVLFVLCTASVFVFYGHSQRRVGRPASRFALDVVLAVSLGIGMAVAQTRAVIEGWVDGWRRTTGTFERTPKRGETRATVKYAARRRPWPLVEMAFAAWLLFSAGHALATGAWGTAPFQLLFASGFSWVAIATIRERRDALRAATTLVPLPARAPRGPPAHAPRREPLAMVPAVSALEARDFEP